MTTATPRRTTPNFQAASTPVFRRGPVMGYQPQAQTADQQVEFNRKINCIHSVEVILSYRQEPEHFKTIGNFLQMPQLELGGINNWLCI